MPAFYASQAYDAPAPYIWSVLTDFPSWPAWFPNMTRLVASNSAAAGIDTELRATGNRDHEWSKWRISRWTDDALLVCEHVESNAPVSRGIDAAYLQFELFPDPEGCTLEVEIGVESGNVIGDFFVGITMGTGARRMLPQLVEAFSQHVVERASRR